MGAAMWVLGIELESFGREASAHLSRPREVFYGHHSRNIREKSDTFVADAYLPTC